MAAAAAVAAVVLVTTAAVVVLAAVAVALAEFRALSSVGNVMLLLYCDLWRLRSFS